MELDGVWTKRRVIWSVIGILVGLFLYFGTGNFTLHPEYAEGKYLWPKWLGFLNPTAQPWSFILRTLVPVGGLLLIGARIVQGLMAKPGKSAPFKVPAFKLLLTIFIMLFFAGMIVPDAVTSNAAESGEGPYYLNLSLASVGSDLSVKDAYDSLVPGPENKTITGRGSLYFAKLSDFYYLCYFGLIAVFGIYWAVKTNSKIIWKRNLTIIACQWTLWWGIPTFMVVLFGRNWITPLLRKSLNAWPLNMTAFKVNPVAGPGDPEWWQMVGVVGVVWAVFLTFVILPLFTIKYGKIYCSYICSCGALAETVGNSFRHRGPKGDTSRRLEKYGYIFILLATVATIADLMGFSPVLWVIGDKEFRLDLLGWYDFWVGTFLAGALAIGLYPFLGQRLWCRMWCPLAFWMNFWAAGRSSKSLLKKENVLIAMLSLIHI